MYISYQPLLRTSTKSLQIHDEIYHKYRQREDLYYFYDKTRQGTDAQRWVMMVNSKEQQCNNFIVNNWLTEGQLHHGICHRFEWLQYGHWTDIHIRN